MMNLSNVGNPCVSNFWRVTLEQLARLKHSVSDLTPSSPICLIVSACQEQLFEFLQLKSAQHVLFCSYTNTPAACIAYVMSG